MGERSWAARRARGTAAPGSGAASRCGTLLAGIVVGLVGFSPAALAQDQSVVPQVLTDFLGPAIAFTLAGVGTVLVLLVVLLMLLAWRSQGIFRQVATDRHHLLELALKENRSSFVESGFFEAEMPPLALPEGSVRAVIAVSIVLISLAFVVVFMASQALGIPEYGLPEIVATVLGTVLGFYFGARGTAETKAVLRQATHQAQESQRVSQEVVGQALERTLQTPPASASTAAAPTDPAVFASIRRNAGDLVTAAEAITTLLPANQGKRLKQTVAAASTALDLADRLLGDGKRGDALDKAKQAQGEAERSFTELVQDAIDGVAPMVGGLVPGGTLVLGLIRVGAGLTGQAYERWRNEVLSAPHSVDLFPPTAVSADVAMPLMRKVESLAALFADELARGDRAAVTAFKDLALTEDGPRAVASRFHDPGGDLTREGIEAGVEAFRDLVRQDLLLRDVPAEMLAAEDVKGAVGAVDRMATQEEDDPTAAAALAQVHKLVLTIDKLNELGMTGQLVDVAKRVIAPTQQPEAA